MPRNDLFFRCWRFWRLNWKTRCRVTTKFWRKCSNTLIHHSPAWYVFHRCSSLNFDISSDGVYSSSTTTAFQSSTGPITSLPTLCASVTFSGTRTHFGCQQVSGRLQLIVRWSSSSRHSMQTSVLCYGLRSIDNAWLRQTTETGSFNVDY